MIAAGGTQVDRIGVVGCSYRSADMDTVAAMALPPSFPSSSLVELARLAGFSELVYLGTCNRVEFYFRAHTRLHTGPLLFHLRRSLADLTEGGTQVPQDEQLYVLFGRAAVRHLFRVTASLDSMMVGEAQIGGQTKDAHEAAHEADLLSGILDQTFHEAFNLAKRVRSETELARRPVSLMTLTERTVHEHLASSVSPVLLMGAGKMAAEALRLIRGGAPEREVVVANRTPGRGEMLVKDDPVARAVRLDQVLADPPGVALVVTVTSSEEAILGHDQVVEMRSKLPPAEELLLIDLALPPNVDRSVATLDGVTLQGLEEMREKAEANQQRRLAEMQRCDSLVEHQLLVLRRRLLNRALSPVAQAIHRSFDELAERVVDHSLARELVELEDHQREAVKRMTGELMQRLVQVPLRGLRGAAWHHSSAVLDGFLKGLEKDGDPTLPEEGGE
jgi:glutamyl-tRNA reductase